VSDFVTKNLENMNSKKCNWKTILRKLNNVEKEEEEPSFSFSVFNF
jgi:hypothetical protein